MWINKEAYKQLIKITEQLEKQLANQREIYERMLENDVIQAGNRINEFRASITELRNTFDKQIQSLKLHYENQLQRLTAENRALLETQDKFVDRFMIALGLSQVHNTVTPTAYTHFTVPEEQNSDPAKVPPHLSGAMAAVIRAMEEDEENHKRQQEDLQLMAERVAQEQKERDSAKVTEAEG